ncbi:helix-hairpin-helix domain-containing protein [Pseudomonas lundensis]|uniref:ComEA family DNA-binding protein n=3 Tax=Pseudomonas TaxID=286 RepID=UPI0014731807|nr:ComEA family DNA-binding protein [Pseudomonas lundensis]NNA06958.1 helix-hairpin-helix domain-containing protein [Pseudomonas lundensis]
MRITLVPSFVMAVLLGFSGAVVANTAPASPAPVVSEAVISPEAQVVTINLNTADEATLQRELLGVGAAKAKAIVAYREANGDFASTDELMEVKGIGKAIFEKNRDKVAINCNRSMNPTFKALS